jgi:hypothetical protein
MRLLGGWRELLELTACHALPRKGWFLTTGRRTLHSFCKARLVDRRWSDDELCEPSEVLRDCRQCELELGTGWPAQALTTEPKDTLEMCK